MASKGKSQDHYAVPVALNCVSSKGNARSGSPGTKHCFPGCARWSEWTQASLPGAHWDWQRLSVQQPQRKHGSGAEERSGRRTKCRLRHPQPVERHYTRQGSCHTTLEQSRWSPTLAQVQLAVWHSPWVAPAVGVAKKDTTCHSCVNDVTGIDSYPLPCIDDALNHIAGSSWFSSLDLCSGY